MQKNIIHNKCDYYYIRSVTRMIYVYYIILYLDKH